MDRSWDWVFGGIITEKLTDLIIENPVQKTATTIEALKTLKNDAKGKLRPGHPTVS